MASNRVEPDSKSATVRSLEEVETLKTKEVITLKYSASSVQVFFMGISIIVGGQFMGWNKALTMGLWECMIGLAIVSIGYFCLTFCLAEMASILPFAGGSFGYVRCSLGPRVGYNVGFCESVAYILFVAAALDNIDEIIRLGANLPSDASFFIYIAFYVIGIPIMCMGGPWIWWFSTIVSILAMGLVGVYCISNIHHDDVMKFSSNHHVGQSMMSYLKWLPLLTWFLKGIEPVTLACNNVDQPGKKLPKVMIGIIIVVILSSFFILLTTCSIGPLGPYDLAGQAHFAGYVYVEGLNLKTRPLWAGLLALPACIGTAYGYIYAFGQQLHSLAQSGLAPSFLKRCCGAYDAPYAAVMAGSVVSLLVTYMLRIFVNNIAETLFGMCMLSTCMVNVSLCMAYYVFKDRYSGLEHEFINPFGIVSAIVGGLIFAFIAIAIAFFREDNYTALSFFIVIMIIGMLYYQFVARKTECFSKEEQEKFFKAYVLNANVMKRKGQNKKRKHNSIAPSTAAAAAVTRGDNNVSNLRSTLN